MVNVDSIAEHDDRKRYCPILGHEIRFDYCRRPGCETPCRKILDCWWQMFDIKEFLARHYTEETIQKMLAPPQSKVVTLYELIQRARSAGQSD